MYRDVVESVNEILFQTDGEDRVTFLNRAWRHTTGFDGRLSIGQSLLDFVADDDRSRVEQHLRSIREALQKLYRHADKAPDLRAALAAATPEEGGGGLTLTPHKTHTTRFVAIPATRHPLPLKVSQ